MSVDDFLPGHDEPGMDIMQNKSAFRRQQETFIPEAMEKPETEPVDDEDRRVFALNFISSIAGRVNVDNPLAMADDVARWLRDGTLPVSDSPSERAESDAEPA